MKNVNNFNNAGLICGLEYEAQCLRLAGIKNDIRVSGANIERTKELAEHLIENGSEVLISIGFAGGLDPRLDPGSLILADKVVIGDPKILSSKKSSTMGELGNIFSFRQPLSSNEFDDSSVVQEDTIGTVFNTDKVLNSKLLALLNVEVSYGKIIGVNQVIATPKDKIRAFGRTGCLACDMESHVVGMVAHTLGIPFVVLRVVCDPSNRYIPQSALKGIKDTGGASYIGTLKNVCLRPWEIPDLISLWYDSRVAFKALRNVATMSLPLF